MMRLANLAHGRDNNFNLIRMAAALIVLVSHSLPLSIGSPDAEPLHARFGMSTGRMAVDLFFVASGFLVTASLLARRDVVQFAWARVLRIFPALVVVVLLTVFGLGVVFTSLPLDEYFADNQTQRYLLKGVTLFAGVGYTLPGVFDDAPYRSIVNGSLWTLPYEVKMYAILAIVWAALGLAGRRRETVMCRLIVAACPIAGATLLLEYYVLGDAGNFNHFFYMFFAGATLFVLKDCVVLDRRIFWAMLAALLAAAWVDREPFFAVYVLTVPYLLIYLAYVPAGAIRAYNRVGDYSYGMYIYAFPIQQSVATLVPGISALGMIALAGAASFACAALSWHLLERRALGLKDRVEARAALDGRSAGTADRAGL